MMMSPVTMTCLTNCLGALLSWCACIDVIIIGPLGHWCMSSDSICQNKRIGRLNFSVPPIFSPFLLCERARTYYAFSQTTMKIDMVSTATDKKKNGGSPTGSTEDDNSIDLRDAVVPKDETMAAPGDTNDDDDIDDDEDGESPDDQLDDDFTDAGSYDGQMEISGNGRSDDYDNDDDNAFDVILNKKESRWVLRSRTLVLLVLFLSALCLAIGAAFIVKNQQQDAFETS
jgi:hypothetical protein